MSEKPHTAPVSQGEPNFVLEHPGFFGVLFALAVVAAFLGALYVTSGGGEHEAKAAVPAASAEPAAK